MAVSLGVADSELVTLELEGEVDVVGSEVTVGTAGATVVGFVAGGVTVVGGLEAVGKADPGGELGSAIGGSAGWTGVTALGAVVVSPVVGV